MWTELPPDAQGGQGDRLKRQAELACAIQHASGSLAAQAQLSGLKFALIDRLDVLAVKHRPKLAYLLAELAKLGNIDSVILCGTMKEKPAMPAEFLTQSLWIEKGVVLSQGIE